MPITSPLVRPCYRQLWEPILGIGTTVVEGYLGMTIAMRDVLHAVLERHVQPQADGGQGC